MPALGQSILVILIEIINSTISTAIVIAKNVVLLFNIIILNSSRASPLALAMATFILAVMLFALFRYFKAEAKTLIIALLIFAALALLAVIL